MNKLLMASLFLCATTPITSAAVGSSRMETYSELTYDCNTPKHGNINLQLLIVDTEDGVQGVVPSISNYPNAKALTKSVMSVSLKADGQLGYESFGMMNIKGGGMDDYLNVITWNLSRVAGVSIDDTKCEHIPELNRQAVFVDGKEVK
jgi:hypothetical protein